MVIAFSLLQVSSWLLDRLSLCSLVVRHFRSRGLVARSGVGHLHHLRIAVPSVGHRPEVLFQMSTQLLSSNWSTTFTLPSTDAWLELWRQFFGPFGKAWRSLSNTTLLPTKRATKRLLSNLTRKATSNEKSHADEESGIVPISSMLTTPIVSVPRGVLTTHAIYHVCELMIKFRKIYIVFFGFRTAMMHSVGVWDI